MCTPNCNYYYYYKSKCQTQRKRYTYFIFPLTIYQIWKNKFILVNFLLLVLFIGSGLRIRNQVQFLTFRFPDLGFPLCDHHHLPRAHPSSNPSYNRNFAFFHTQKHLPPATVSEIHDPTQTLRFLGTLFFYPPPPSITDLKLSSETKRPNFFIFILFYIYIPSLVMQKSDES